MNPASYSIIGLDLVPSTGGPAKTIRYFSEAYNGKVYSLTNERKLQIEGSSFKPITHYTYQNTPWKNLTSYIDKEKQEALLKELSLSSIISCHILYRYHVHLVNKLYIKKSIPYVVVPHGCLDPYTLGKNKLLKKLWFSYIGKQFLRQASAVIFSTNKEREKASFLLKNCRTTVMHWPTPFLDISRKANCKVEFLKRHNLPLNSRIAVSLGRLHTMKNPLMIVEAFAKANLENTYLFLVGPEENIKISAIKTYLSQFPNSAKIIIKGPLWGKEKEELLLASDLYISMSVRENFGHTLAESLSAGLYYIASEGNYLAHDLPLGEGGTILKENTTPALVKALVKWDQLPKSSCKEIGIKNQRWVEQNLKFETFATKIKRLYNSIIDRKVALDYSFEPTFTHQTNRNQAFQSKK